MKPMRTIACLCALFVAVGCQPALEIEVPREGDTVEIFLSPWKAIKAGFLVLIFPLLMFFPPYVIASTTLGIQNETVRILFGTGGIALGFVFNLILKKTKKRSDLPEIRRILDRTDETPYRGYEN